MVILISPLAYWLTGLGQAAAGLPASISYGLDGTLQSSPKAEALRILTLPISLERMLLYPLLLVAFQFSGLSVQLRQSIETRFDLALAHRRVRPLRSLYRRLPQIWRQRLALAKLLTVFLFIVLFNLALVVLYLPFNFYRSFIIGHQFDLSTQTAAGWLSDWGKSVGLRLMMEGSGWTAFFALVKLFPRRWPLIGGGLWVTFSLGLTLLAPILITPLFYEVTPLENPELRQRILVLAERAGTPVDEVYLIDASSKTTAVNAYVTGFGDARRIVLYDTLIEGYSLDEIEVVLAHELGHWVYHHVLWSVIGLGAAGWLGLFVLRWLLLRIWQPLGLRTPADVAGLPFILAVLYLASLLSMPVENAFSRYGERQADAFALAVSQKPEAFVQLFEGMAEQNLTVVDPPTWEKWLFGTHPSPAERIQVARSFEIRQQND
jgi:STE24 endopeptidase